MAARRRKTVAMRPMLFRPAIRAPLTANTAMPNRSSRYSAIPKDQQDLSVWRVRLRAATYPAQAVWPAEKA
jgi:hypothetical protein